MTQTPIPAAAKGLAISALIVGIVAFLIGWVPFLGLLAGGSAIALGIIALVKRQPKAFSIIGLALGAAAVITSLVTTTLVIGATSAGITASTEAVTSEVTKTTPATPEGVQIPDVSGKPGDEAKDTLEALGFYVTTDGGDEAPILLSNWDAVKTDPAAGEYAPEGSAITLYLERATERLETEQAEKETTYNDTPLGATEAQAFCDRYATNEFPYGVKMHWILGKLAEEQTDTGWYMKVEATVTNEYGAELSGVNVECHMSGTNGTPVMDSFIYY